MWTSSKKRNEGSQFRAGVITVNEARCCSGRCNKVNNKRTNSGRDNGRRWALTRGPPARTNLFAYIRFMCQGENRAGFLLHRREENMLQHWGQRSPTGVVAGVRHLTLMSVFLMSKCKYQARLCFSSKAFTWWVYSNKVWRERCSSDTTTCGCWLSRRQTIPVGDACQILFGLGCHR